MKRKSKRISGCPYNRHSNHDHSPYDASFARCSLCGRLGADYYHYLQKDEYGLSMRVAHPVVPLLCERCAWRSSDHGSDICAVWRESFCVIAETQLVTNAALLMTGDGRFEQRGSAVVPTNCSRPGRLLEQER